MGKKKPIAIVAADEDIGEIIEQELQAILPEFEIYLADNDKEAYNLATYQDASILLIELEESDLITEDIFDNFKNDSNTCNIPILLLYKRLTVEKLKNYQEKGIFGVINYSNNIDLQVGLLANLKKIDDFWEIKENFEKEKNELKIKIERVQEKTRKRIKFTRGLNEEKNKVLKQQSKTLDEQKAEIRKLSLVASKTDNSVLLLAPNGMIEWVNEGFEKMFGHTFEKFKEKYGKRIQGFEFAPQFFKAFNQCKLSKQSKNIIICFDKNNDEKIWVQTNLTPVFNEKDRLTQVLAVGSNITKQKLIEKEVKRQKQEVEEKAQILESMNDELEQKKEDLLSLTDHLDNANMMLEQQKEEIDKERKKSESLLLNILPSETAEELKRKGFAEPRQYRKVSVLFTDFKGFTKSCENLIPKELVTQLHAYFAHFDDIIEKYSIEKIKTIGDAYMCAGGIPIRNKSHPFDTVLAGLSIQNYMRELNERKRQNGLPEWYLRLGIHTGEVIAGVVGKKKFAYDIWGDTVNTASRMESSGEVGKVNISQYTYNFIKDFFDCSHRGKIEAKNKGMIDMYFVNRIKPEFSVDEYGIVPNKEFKKYLSSI